MMGRCSLHLLFALSFFPTSTSFFYNPHPLCRAAALRNLVTHAAWVSRARIRAACPHQREISMRARRRPASGNTSLIFEELDEDESLVARIGSGRVAPSARAGAPPRPLPYPASNLDAMRAKAGVLRTSILQQQAELQRIERKIEEAVSREKASTAASTPFESLTQTLDRSVTRGVLSRSIETFFRSTAVLGRKLVRVKEKRGPANMKWTSVGDYVAAQTRTGARIVSSIVQDPVRLKQLADPMSPALIPHVPAILARLDRLESHVAPILERVLNNRRHLASVDPYLDSILERFDDIEPHLPWILDNIDVLAPYTGLLLKHLDSLLLYTDVDKSDGVGSQYALAEQLLPHLEFYVSRLDLIGPHLPLIRPHIPKLLKDQRITQLSPYVDRLWTSQGLDLSISANLDVLLFYFGWIFRVPFLRRAVALFFALPGAAAMVKFLANRLPKRFVRGECAGVTCDVDFDYNTWKSNWNRLSKSS